MRSGQPLMGRLCFGKGRWKRPGPGFKLCRRLRAVSQLSYPRSDYDANGPRFLTPYVLPDHSSWDHDQARMTPKPEPEVTPKLIQFNSIPRREFKLRCQNG